MNCINCGADLRVGARFCNICGTKQVAADSAPAVPESVAPAPAPAGNTDDETTTTTKLKRPPRVPRTTVATLDVGGASEQLERATDAEAASTASEQAEPAEPEVAAEATATAEGTPAATTPAEASTDASAVVEGAEAAPDAASARGMDEAESAAAAGEAAPDIAGEETAEYGALGTAAPNATGGEAIPRQAALVPPLATLAKPATPAPIEERSPTRWDPDGFSWPLPVQIIKGGRYRVEDVVSVAESESGENVYRVRDLQGYERCWSCGTEYGASNAGNTFCLQCGADMLGRPYRMYERRLADTADASADHDVWDDTAERHPEEHRFVEGHRAYRVVPFEPEQSPFQRGVRLQWGLATDVGATRPGEQNEDSLCTFSLAVGTDSHVRPLALAVVADGLGGHASGQEASQLVVQSVLEHVLRHLALPAAGGSRADAQQDDQMTALLADAAREANAALCRVNEEREADMGSTLVTALVVGETAYIANAGDSRAYVLAGGELRRISTDHSLVEQLIIGGIIQPEERYTHPQRNQIYRSLGDSLDMQVDTFIERLVPGTRLLLCSDGLWEMVRDDELLRVLTEQHDPQEAADELVRRANANGGEDNISVIVLDVRA